MPNLPTNDRTRTWAAGDLRRAADASNLDYTKGALLGHYANNPEIFRCPADRTMARGKPRVRSISMNVYFGGSGDGRPSSGRVNQSTHFFFARHSTIRRPSGLWVLWDENPGTVDDCMGVVDVNASYRQSRILVNSPASYHNKAGGLSFADGHAEIKKWSGPGVFEGKWHVFGGEDYDWLADRTTYAK